ncbi:MAG TPA: S46 family peptidase, partial [Caulobacteraceae bacterium]
MKSALRAVAPAALILSFGSGSALADEGLWTFDNFPSARVNGQYGTQIDQAWLDRVRSASVRIPGCSASVVSPSGLMMSNYHCAESCADELSDAEHDYFST